jgi:Holliday junction DNA helicase RuvA
VGRKTAERMVVELKDKVSATGAGVTTGIAMRDGKVKDALSALVNLGYQKGIAEEAVRNCVRQHGEELPLEELLKESLRLLVKH